AGLHRWDEVLCHPSLRAVLEIGVPRRVAEAILRAVFHQHLAGFQSGSKAAEAREHLREVVLPEYGVLFRTRLGLTGFEVDASFLLLDALKQHHNEQAAQI